MPRNDANPEHTPAAALQDGPQSIDPELTGDW